MEHAASVTMPTMPDHLESVETEFWTRWCAARGVLPMLARDEDRAGLTGRLLAPSRAVEIDELLPQKVGGENHSAVRKADLIRLP
jgi:hypothetical protein